MIGARAPGARIVVVGTHADSRLVRASSRDTELLVSTIASSVGRAAQQAGVRVFENPDDAGNGGVSTHVSTYASAHQFPDISTTLAWEHDASATHDTIDDTPRFARPMVFLVDALSDKVGEFALLREACRRLVTDIIDARDVVPDGLVEAAATVQRMAKELSPFMILSDFGARMTETHPWYRENVLPPMLRSCGVLEHFADQPLLRDFVFLSPGWPRCWHVSWTAARASWQPAQMPTLTRLPYSMRGAGLGCRPPRTRRHVKQSCRSCLHSVCCISFQCPPRPLLGDS
jgi:hypothetical protein